MKTPTIVTVGNQTYLAEPLKFDDAGTILVGAMPTQSADVTVQDLKNYIKHSNANTLEKDIVIRGNVAFSERQISDDLSDELAILEAKFKKAEKNALPNLVNQAFDRIA
jgi:hypothetical protein